MIRINLLPVREKKKQESTRKMLAVLFASLAGAGIILYVFHLSLSRQIERVNSQLAEYNAEIARLRIESRKRGPTKTFEHYPSPAASQDGSGTGIG